MIKHTKVSIKLYNVINKIAIYYFPLEYHKCQKQSCKMKRTLLIMKNAKVFPMTKMYVRKGKPNVNNNILFSH
jgi:hypothetical protein